MHPRDRGVFEYNIALFRVGTEQEKGFVLQRDGFYQLPLFENLEVDGRKFLPAL